MAANGNDLQGTGGPSIEELVARQVQQAVAPIYEQIKKMLERSEAEAAAQGHLSPEAPTPRTMSPSAEHLSLRRKPLPNPAKFSGKRSEYAVWSYQMRMKIELDAPFYADNPKSLWYLINSCLEAGPQKTVATFVAAGGPDGRCEATAFMRYLDRTYKDQAVQSRAAAELRRLRQRDNASLAGFLPKFERVLSDAGGGDWADTAKITFLEGALNSQLQRSFATVKMPARYADWVSQAQEIAAKVERLEHQGTHSEPLWRSQRDYEGDTQMGGTSKSRKETHQKKLRRDSSESEASELEPRIEARTCFRCGKKGHILRNCLRDAKKKSKAGDAKKITNPQRKAIEAAASSEESLSESDSPKEEP